MQNSLPAGWQQTNMGTVTNIYLGGTPSRSVPEYWNGGIKWISIQDISNSGGRYIANTVETITSEGIANSAAKILPMGTIVVSSRGTVGEIGMLAEPMAFNQSCYGLLPKDENQLDQTFLYYSLKNSVRNARNIAHGGVFDTFTKETFNHINLTYPKKIDKQKQIASILSSFDDKIELNNKIAKTLEEMMQAIFKEWFINFRFPGYEKVEFVDSELGKIPDTWEIRKLEQIIKIKHGFAFKGEQFISNKTKNIVVRMGNFKGSGGLQFLDNTVYIENIKGAEKYLLNHGDIVMIFSDITREGRLIGNVGAIPNNSNNYILNQRVAKIEHEIRYKYFLLSLFNSLLFHRHCLQRADSATVLNLKNEHVYEYQIVNPDEVTLERFNNIVSDIYQKIELIDYENQNLAALRDLLLPKLMKGEIKV